MSCGGVAGAFFHMRAPCRQSGMSKIDRNAFVIAISRNPMAERHIRHLAPLAFVSPRIVEAIASGNAPADLTITMLARALPRGWAAQEHKLGIT